MEKALARGLVIWLLIMIAESVHGIIRRLMLEPLIGDGRARQFSVFTGVLLIFVITLMSIRWIRLTTTAQLLLLGFLWVMLTLAFEFLVGMFAFGYSLDRISEDLDPRRGGLMGFGLIFMLVIPLIAARLRGNRPNAII